jgi:hypothetical protein
MGTRKYGCEIVAEGTRIALRELARLVEIGGKGRGLAAHHDRRSRLCDPGGTQRPERRRGPRGHGP